MAGKSVVDQLLEEELGGNNVPAVVTPGPKDDPHERLISQMLSEELADSLEKNRTATMTHAPQNNDFRAWTSGDSMAQGALQGAYPWLLSHGAGFNPASVAASHETFKKEHSLADEGAQTVGSALTALPLMAAGQEYVAAPLAARLAGMGRFAPSIVDFLSGATKGAGWLPSTATRGAIEGAANAGISSQLRDEPILQQMKTGALTGAAFNPAFRYLFPGKDAVTKTTAESAKGLLDQGVNVQYGQLPGATKPAQILSNVFGGTKGQGEQFAEALSKQTGYPTKEINQEWVNGAKAAEGRTMNTIQANYGLPKGGDLNTVMDLNQLRLAAHDNLSAENAQKVWDAIDRIEVNLNKGINGNVYKNITQKSGLIDNLAKDKDIQNFISGHVQLPGGASSLREILDDAWGRALPADKKELWDQARSRYKMLSTIDDSMGAVGASTGRYNPRALMKAVEGRYGNVENAGELGLLARGGQFLPAETSRVKEGLGTAVKHAGNAAIAGAAFGAVQEGAHPLTHMGPELLGRIAEAPDQYTIPALLALGGLGAGRATHWMLNSPRATQYAVDVARGARSPVLQGMNPLLPFVVEGANR